jgi:DNA repair exonuclease SbcCD ATPase subunit
MPDMNDLLRDAIRLCGELSGELQEAEDAVADLMARSHALGAAVAAGSEDAHQHLQELQGKLGAAERELIEERHEMQPALDGAAHEAQRVQARAASLAEGITAGLDQVLARRAELDVQQDDVADGARADAEAVTRLARELEDALDSGVEQAGAAVASFRVALDEARAGWREALDQVGSDLDQAEQAAREQVRGHVSRVEGGLHKDVAALGHDLPQEALIEPHNRTVGGLVHRLTEDVRSQLAEALEPVRQAMQELERSCRGDQDRLQADTGAVLKKAEAALRRLERLRPSWALAQRLG